METVRSPCTDVASAVTTTRRLRASSRFAAALSLSLIECVTPAVTFTLADATSRRPIRSLSWSRDMEAQPEQDTRSCTAPCRDARTFDGPTFRAGCGATGGVAVARGSGTGVAVGSGGAVVGTAVSSGVAVGVGVGDGVSVAVGVGVGVGDGVGDGVGVGVGVGCM